MLLYVAVSIRWISIRFDFTENIHLEFTAQGSKNLYLSAKELIFFFTNSDFLFPASLQPDGVNL